LFLGYANGQYMFGGDPTKFSHPPGTPRTLLTVRFFGNKPSKLRPGWLIEPNKRRTSSPRGRALEEGKATSDRPGSEIWGPTIETNEFCVVGSSGLYFRAGAELALARGLRLSG